MNNLEKSVEIQTIPLAERNAKMDQYDAHIEELKRQNPIEGGSREIDKRYDRLTREAGEYCMTHFTEEELLQRWYDKLPADQRSIIGSK